MTTVILSNNALSELPSAMGSLSKLRNLEVANNQLTSLPDSFSELKQLQVIARGEGGIGMMEGRRGEMSRVKH